MEFLPYRRPLLRLILKTPVPIIGLNNLNLDILGKKGIVEFLTILDTHPLPLIHRAGKFYFKDIGVVLSSLDEISHVSF